MPVAVVLQVAGRESSLVVVALVKMLRLLRLPQTLVFLVAVVEERDLGLSHKLLFYPVSV